MAATLHDDLGDTAGREPAATTTANPARLQLELPALGLAQVAVAAEHPEDRGTHLGKVLEDAGALGPVEGEDDVAGQRLVLGRRVEVGGAVLVDDEGPAAIGGFDFAHVRPQRPEVGKHLLVLGGPQRGLVVVWTGRREEQGGRGPDAVGDPRVEDARVPGAVEGGAAERSGGGVAVGPGLAAEGGSAGGGLPRADGAGEGEGGDGGVEEDEGGEEARVQEGEPGETGGAEGVAEADEGAGHLGAEDVGQVQEVARVVVPRGVGALGALVEGPAVALVRDVGDPDAADAEACSFSFLPVRVRVVVGEGVQVGPQRLVQLLGEAVGVGGYDGDVARAGGRVVDGDVLLHAQVQDVLLRGGGGARPLADVLRRHDVLFDVEGERRRHLVCSIGPALGSLSVCLPVCMTSLPFPFFPSFLYIDLAKEKLRSCCTPKRVSLIKRPIIGNSYMYKYNLITVTQT